MHRFSKGLQAIAGLLVLSSASFAAEAHVKDNVVYVNNVPILEWKSGSDPSRIASDIAKNLRTLDEESVVKVRSVGEDAKVFAGQIQAVMVSSQEARSHQTTAPMLAEKWASKLRDALALPPLKFSEEFLREPLGTTKHVGLVGSLAFHAEVSCSSDSVAKVARTESGFDIQFVGNGDTRVTAISGNAQRTLNVAVRPYAGTFPQEFMTEVVGSPAAKSTVSGAVEACLRTRVVSLPTATCSFIPVSGDALAVGATKTYAVRLRLKAPDAFDAVGNVSVTVRNLALTNTPDSALWYSNAPEAVRQVGPLFSSTLKSKLPVRFLYHHINIATQPMLLRVEAINDSDVVAKVLITPGDSKPDKNPVRAGMTAARQFLELFRTSSGEVVSLPPHTTFPISIRRISPKETVSGLCTLQLIDGPADVQVRADALPPFELRGAWYDASLSSTPWREAGTHPVNEYDRGPSEPSTHVYPNPYKDEHLDYRVGGRYGFLLLGQKPISGEDHMNNLDGNFGVIYRISVSITNPTAEPTDVDLAFEASAGYMGGLFLLDQKLVQTPLLGPKQESRLGRFHLASGASKHFEILTLPVSGGSYPATLFLRPAEQRSKG